MLVFETRERTADAINLLAALKQKRLMNEYTNDQISRVVVSVLKTSPSDSGNSVRNDDDERDQSHPL